MNSSTNWQKSFCHFRPLRRLNKNRYKKHGLVSVSCKNGACCGFQTTNHRLLRFRLLNHTWPPEVCLGKMKNEQCSGDDGIVWGRESDYREKIGWRLVEGLEYRVTKLLKTCPNATCFFWIKGFGVSHMLISNKCKPPKGVSWPWKRTSRCHDSALRLAGGRENANHITANCQATDSLSSWHNSCSCHDDRWIVYGSYWTQSTVKATSVSTTAPQRTLT